MSHISIFAGTVYGNSQHVADEAKAMIENEGLTCDVFTDPDLSDFTDAESVVFICSTTGQGDVPPNLELFFSELNDKFPLMNNKKFAVAGLGDSSYSDSFCGGARQFFELLTELQGNPVADMLEVDAMETLAAEDEVLPWLKALLPSFTR